MLSFFRKRNEKMLKLGKDSAVNSKDILGIVGQDPSDSDIQTTLSFHPESQVGSEERYYYQFLHNELPPLKSNQISLSGIEIKQEEEFWHVIAFVRNSLSVPIRFEELPLVLVGPNGETIAQKEFSLSELGELPPHTSRPWIFVFHQSELFIQDLPSKGWMLSFDLVQKHQLDLDPSWDKTLPPQKKDGLRRFVESLDAPKPNELSLVGLDASMTEVGDLHVTLLIRNGGPEDIHIEKLPLVIADATGEDIAIGSFNMNNLIVKNNTSKPWSFIFPSNMLKNNHLDLSSWRVSLLKH